MKPLAEVTPFGISASKHSGGLKVHLSPGLATWVLKDVSGAEVALIHGCVLHDWCGQGTEITGSEIKAACDLSTVSALEDFIGDLHGSFVVETLAPLPHRLYPDAGGTIPIVYCPCSQRLASSASMMFDAAEYKDRFLTERYERLILNDVAGACIPGFLTAHEGLWRLLPNFCLDLESWTAHRFWPRPEDIGQSHTLEEAADIVADALRGYVNAAVQQFQRISPTLTAGFDSRVLMAACRDIPRNQLDFFTVGRTKDGIDQIMSAEMAQALGVPHRLIPPRAAAPQEAEMWDRMVGHCTREVTRETHPTLWQVQSDVIFTGMYGETGRSRLYIKELDAINGFKADAQFVAGRLGARGQDREVLETLEKWVQTIHWAPTSKILDLTFNELRFGGWAMPQATVQRAIQFSLMPLSQRRIQDAFMHTPPGVKTSTALFHSICQRLWPETMGFGVNKFGDHRDQLKFFGKFFKRDSLTRSWRLLRTRVQR